MSSAISSKVLQKLYKAELEGCQLAMDSSEAKVQFQSLGNKVNKPHIEFSPIPITDDKIIYGSYKEDQVRVYELNDTVPFEIDKRKFFIAEKEGEEGEESRRARAGCAHSVD